MKIILVLKINLSIWVHRNSNLFWIARLWQLQKSMDFISEKKTAALLVGSYVDAHFSNELAIFKAQNPEIFTRNGDLKSEYKKSKLHYPENRTR